MIESLLTKRAQEALERYAQAGVVLVNQKKDGFDGFKSSDALALMIAGVAAITDGELRLTNVGAMLKETSWREHETESVNRYSDSTVA